MIVQNYSLPQTQLYAGQVANNYFAQANNARASGGNQNGFYMKVEQHRSKGRFLGYVYACLIFVFLLMAGATVLSMYSSGFRAFIRSKITVIILGVFMIILSLVFMCCEQVIKSFQAIFFLIFSIGLAMLAGSLVAHLKSMIVVYAIFLILFLVVGLAIFAFTTSSTFGNASSYLSVFGIALIGLGAFSMYWRQDVSTICYASIVVALFGFYLVYFTQTISSKYGNGYDDNDFFTATLSIFISLVQLAVGFLGMSLIG